MPALHSRRCKNRHIMCTPPQAVLHREPNQKKKVENKEDSNEQLDYVMLAQVSNISIYRARPPGTNLFTTSVIQCSSDTLIRPYIYIYIAP